MSVRAASSCLLGWPLGLSVAVHGTAVFAASLLATAAPAAPPDPVPIEVVRLEPPPPPPPPERPKPPRPAAITAPRLVTRPAEPAPPAPALLDEAPRREPAPPLAESSGAGRLPTDAGASRWTMPGAGGDARGSRTLLSTGDLPLPGSAGGPAGRGRDAGAGTQVAVAAGPDGLTSFARPVGGYQTRPRYPESARRQGIEGETLLRFQVRADGRVASVSVAKSAGDADLDRAAVAAVRTWLFEPARRGREAVAVWVTLPVRFQLESGVGQ